MRFRTVSVFGALLIVCLAAAAWATPLPAPLSIFSNPPAESHSVSGKISAVGDMQFSVDVVKNQQPDTLQFKVDSNTKIEGKLAVGAQASVEYQVTGSDMIATRVVVTPASGIGQ